MDLYTMEANPILWYPWETLFRKGDVTNEVMFMVVCDSILVVITLSLSLRTREADCNFKF